MNFKKNITTSEDPLQMTALKVALLEPFIDPEYSGSKDLHKLK